eukprot:1483471-Pyramimonas_sp.AAC.1
MTNNLPSNAKQCQAMPHSVNQPVSHHDKQCQTIFAKQCQTTPRHAMRPCGWTLSPHSGRA